MHQVKPGTVVSNGGLIPEHWVKEEILQDVLVAGGFKIEQIEIKSVLSRMSFLGPLMWASEGMQTFKQFLTKVIENWEEVEREEFVKALEERIVREESTEYQIIAWIVIAKK